MDPLCNLTVTDDPSLTLTLAPERIAALHLVHGQHVQLHVGGWSANVQVREDPSTEPSALALSPSVLAALELSSFHARDFTYRLRRGKSGEWRLGPIIGVLVGQNRDEIPRNRHGYQVFDTLWNVRHIGGLVYYFSLDDIDWGNRRIFGHVYIPHPSVRLLPQKVPFKTGCFPFPQAIYRRSLIPADVLKRIHTEITPYVFNTFDGSNRLAQVEALLADPSVAAHVPETKPLSSENLTALLRRHGTVYVKASGRGAGSAAYRVTSGIGGGYAVTSRVSSRGAAEHVREAPSYDALLDLFTEGGQRTVEPSLWCVQERVQVARWQGRPFDLRVTVQRNGLGEWTVNGAYARVAPTADSAITRLGEYFQARTLLTRRWPLLGRRIFDRTLKVALACAHALGNAFGSIGDIGIDLVLDEKGKAWFLEANPGPGYRKVDADDTDYWLQIMHPILYASYLSGFPVPPRDWLQDLRARMNEPTSSEG